MQKNDFVEMFKDRIDEWEWVLQMAQNGVNTTEGAGDDPRNVFLYMLQCDLKEAKDKTI